MKPPPETLIVRKAPNTDPASGLLQFGDHVWPCILGKNGISTTKREGDMKTPAGRFKLLFGYYRKDRLGLIKSSLPLHPINSQMAWCDEPGNPNYNRPVNLPFTASHEKLLRNDNLYDITIVMDHNFHKRTKNQGSAVFFHLTANKPYTAGCVAIAPPIMRFLLPKLTQETEMIIKA